MSAQDLLRLVALHQLGTLAPLGYATFRIQHENGVVTQVLYEGAKTGCLGAALGFCEHTLGLVAKYLGKADQLSGLIDVSGRAPDSVEAASVFFAQPPV